MVEKRRIQTALEGFKRAVNGGCKWQVSLAGKAASPDSNSEKTSPVMSLN